VSIRQSYKGWDGWGWYDEVLIGVVCRFMASSKVLGEETVKGGDDKGKEEK
jgi:hypothetical protein